MPVLNWIAKDSVVTYHSKVPFRTLSLTYGYTAEHRREEGLSSESGNMIVYGDNLLSLKALLPLEAEDVPEAISRVMAA